ncbi:hypothetical protein ABZ177_23255 [Streptomyces sp. NPDC006284]|uniref:hypothetical protein n=1 Tax=Streptomyces sp. NPDC006284 TaxID=3156742 RepID=UPI0033A1A25E
MVGLILGGLWAYQHGAPLWDHAVRMLILLLIVPPMLHRRRTRRRRRLGLEGEPHLSLMRLSVVKVSIVAAALLAAWLLRGRVAGADFWIAGGLTVTVAIVGPLMHRWLIVGGSHATSPRHASRK